MNPCLIPGLKTEGLRAIKDEGCHHNDNQEYRLL